MRERFQISPATYSRIATAALIALATIVLTGAAVRLSGSGLGCPDWPKCHGGVIAPANINSWIEYGNRLFSGIVVVATGLAGGLAWFRRPFRRDLAIVGLLLPLGVIAQAALGALTVLYELNYGFVIAHFMLSMLILVAAVALAWLARYEPGERPRSDDRLAVLSVRALLCLATVLLLLGTVTTAAGPHPGSTATGEVVPRVDFKGSDTLDFMIHWHGRFGTLLGISIVAVWFLLARRGFHGQVRWALGVAAVGTAAQGVIGLIQYLNALPPGVVWLHILVATLVWVSLLWAVMAAGRLEPRRSRVTGRGSVPMM